MEDRVMLVDSLICRLCGEENINGTPLFNNDENERDLCTTVNKYLPIKVKDDGKLPRTICPGCNIQLEAMVQFMELIITGQEKLRELLKLQGDYLRSKIKDKNPLTEGIFDTNLETFTIQAVEEDGKEIVLQIMPDGSLYSTDHELSLKSEGLEKPRRKRGRPPKPPPSEIIEETKKEDNEEDEMEVDIDGKRRRRRKIPTRFLEAVQGKELERIFREEGVIDGEEESEDEEQADDKTIKNEDIVEDEVIGHLENLDGQDLGEVIVVSKGKNRPKPLKKRKKNYVCDICNRSFMHHGRYVIHKTYHKGVKYECTECNELFLSKDDLSEHHTSTGHTGEGVIESLENEEALRAEDKEGEEIKIEITLPTELKYSCVQCDKSFMSKQSYEVHLKAIHEGQKPFQCDKCDKSFAYQASLRSHMTSHEQKIERGYSCDVCTKVFNHPSSVVYHKEAEHNNGRRFVCNKCGKSFKHKQLLQRHQLVHSDERPFQCKSCGATFKTKANLLNHMPTHTGVKKYFCQQCGQLFAHKTSLTLHYRWHSGQKPYECPVCKKAFSQKGNLQEHKRIHTGEKPYSCEYCGRKFTTSSQFKLHIKRHTGERPWSCEICSKTFLHKDTWKCHMRRHRNEKPFQCDSCLRGFTEQWALKKHMRLHTGEKPYVCELCNKAFADCSNLTKHKKVHKNLKENLQAIVSQSGSGDGNSIFYVTYQDGADSELPTTLVQILDEPSPLSTNDTNMSHSDETLDGSLVLSDQPSQLQLESFADSETLTLNAGQLQVQDEEGNPIYYTTQTGEQLRVSTFDGESLQVTTDNGTIIPIQLSVENGKAVAVAMEMPIVTEDDLDTKDFHIDDNITSVSSVCEEKSPEENNIDTNDVNNLINPSMHFMTEDGQNVCFVLGPDNMNSEYLSIS